MAKYKITTDVFTLPYENGNQILYAPLKNLVCVINKDTGELLADLFDEKDKAWNEEQLSTLRFFEEKGILNGEFGMTKRIPPEKFAPTRLTLFPTNQCNLRCTYCYASAGDFVPLQMPMETARAAIDFVAENAKEKNIKSLEVGFHGGGEPLLHWKLIQNIVEYVIKRAQEEDLQPVVYSATNGVLTNAQLDWIIRHFKNLNISFDGLPDIQNTQRPLPNGKGSFALVDHTMKYLDEHHFPYGIRATVSEINIDLMEETIDFIGQNYNCKSVHFEPLFYCGRCKTTQAASLEI